MIGKKFGRKKKKQTEFEAVREGEITMIPWNPLWIRLEYGKAVFNNKEKIAETINYQYH